MSQKLKANLQVISLVLGICIAVFGAVGAWAVIPYRLEQAEAEIRALKDDRATDREILVRIDERVNRLLELQKEQR